MSVNKTPSSAESNTAIKPILIVDDEPQMLEALTDLLGDDYRVIVTTSPAEGLSVMQREPSLAVILCDQRMPKMQGDEFLARAKELSFATRIMITGFADMEAVVRAVNDGKIFGYVSKPWDPEGLKITVHRAVEFFELNGSLEVEKALFHDLMENSSDAIFFKDEHLRYQRINKSTARILGLTETEDAYGRSDEDFLPSNLGKSHLKEETELLRSGKPISGRVEQLSMNGKLTWLQTNKAPTRDGHGRITGLVGVTRDITTQKNNENDLKLLLGVTRAISNAMDIREAFHHAINPICQATGWEISKAWVLNDGQVWQLIADTSTSYEPGEPYHQQAADSENGSVPGERARQAAATGEMDWTADLLAQQQRSGLEGPDGIDNIRSMVSVPIMSDSECLGVICWYSRRACRREARIARLVEMIAQQLGPVLRRHRFEIALQTSEKRFRTLIAESAQGVLVSRNFKPIYANKQFARMFGYAKVDDVLAMRTTLDMVHPDDIHRLNTLRDTMRRSPDGRVTCEMRCKTATGDEMNVICHSARVPWDDGWATCIYLHDVTEQRQAEAHLLQAQKMDTVGQLTGGIAHDFNNILTVIQGNLELMSQALQDFGDARLTKWQGAALRATQRGADLTRRLLAFSRRQVLESEILDVNETLRGARSLLERTLREDIEIETRLAADISPIRADASQLENAILNLAINARDAMPLGGRIILETTELHLDQRYADFHDEVTPGRHVLISISDTGTGIPKNILPRVLEPFFTTKEVGKGTGLGLPMIYGFVKQSKGHLSIYSEEGHGTTVKLYFPALHEEIEPRVTEQFDHDNGEILPARILLVEDNEDVRGVAQTMLSAMGYDVIIASNGREALEQLDNNPDIDLLFTDIVMPGGMNGLDVAAAARKRRPDIPVLYTSGYAEGALQYRTDIKPDSEWLAKPYTQAVLAKKIRAVLRR